jgi:hypothetical protein
VDRNSQNRQEFDQFTDQAFTSYEIEEARINEWLKGSQLLTFGLSLPPLGIPPEENQRGLDV